MQLNFVLFITDLGENVFVQLDEPIPEDYATNYHDNVVDLNIQQNCASHYVF
jgi:hypothetical protein